MKETQLAAEMQLGRFAQKTHGLQATEMHLRVLTLLEMTDCFTMLALLDGMMDDLARYGVKALGQNPTGLTKRQATLVLADLRRWFVVNYCHDVVACCDQVSLLARRVAALETENAAMKAQLNNGWTDRVTYENVVEQIAACEDASERDDARKLIEPMLKREMARRFREDIRNKVMETQGEKGVKFVIDKADVKVQCPGNNIAHAIYMNE